MEEMYQYLAELTGLEVKIVDKEKSTWEMTALDNTLRKSGWTLHYFLEGRAARSPAIPSPRSCEQLTLNGSRRNAEPRGARNN